MIVLLNFWPFVAKLLTATLLQFLSIFGVFIVFGLVLYLLARRTRHLFVEIMGEKSDIYFTGWLGTPVHELGHAIFCIPFFHKITDMKLFSVNDEDGSLGYVNHSYNPMNPWHQIGNFFISMGPILFGSFIIYLLVRFLLPFNYQILSLLSGSSADLTSVAGFCNLLTQTLNSSLQVMSALFSSANIHQWQFWVFLYVCVCISSHMELSPPDLSGLGSGTVAILVILMIINLVLMLFNVNGGFMMSIGHWTSLTTGIFTLAVTVSAFNLLLSFIVLNIISLIINKKIIF